MLRLAPAGTCITVVSPAGFPTTKEVSSALYFGITATCGGPQRISIKLQVRNPRDGDPQMGTFSKFRIAYCGRLGRQNGSTDNTMRYLRCDSLKSRDVSISLRRRLRLVSQVMIGDSLVYLLANVRLGEYLECVCTVLLALLDALLACSGRSKAYVQMSVISMRSKGHSH